MESHKRTVFQDRSLRFLNEVVYNAFAPAYDAMDWLTFGAWWRLVRRALGYVPEGGRVLEIGFGPGKLQVALARRATLCLGLDLARGMCRFTQRRLRRAELPSRITRGSAFALPYPSDTFDTVVSTFAFSGLPDGAEAVRETARVLGPGGRFVLVDIGLPGDGNWLGTALARTWERMGDFLYDQPAQMEAAGLSVRVFEAFGPGKHIRAIVGEKGRGS